MPKILYYLSLLAKPAFTRFKTFVESPYFNPRKDLLRLLEVLRPYAQLTKWDGWEEAAYSSWQKQKPFNQNQFRKACSALLDLLHQFIGTEYYRKQTGLVILHQLWALNQMGADKYFGSYYQQAAQRMEQDSARVGEDDFWLNSMLVNTYITHAHLLPQRKEVRGFEEAVRYLDHYYLLRKLKYAIALLAQKQMLGSDEMREPLLIQALVEHVKTHPERWHPIIHAYCALWFAYQHQEDDSHYLEIRRLLEAHHQTLDPNELRELLTGMINYCTAQLRLGSAFFSEEYGRLYLFMIEHDLLWLEGRILAWHVKNLTIYYLRRKQYEQLQHFLELSQSKLIASQRQQVLLFCQGLMAYYQQDYSLAKKSFERLLTKFDDVFYGLDARVAKAWILYELGDDQLEFLLDSAPRYIRAKAVSKEQKNPRLNFFRFLRRLHNTKPYDKQKLNKLEAQVLTETQVSSKKWLLTQIKKRGNLGAG